jgi:hypothetical protein
MGGPVVGLEISAEVMGMASVAEVTEVMPPQEAGAEVGAEERETQAVLGALEAMEPLAT